MNAFSFARSLGRLLHLRFISFALLIHLSMSMGWALTTQKSFTVTAMVTGDSDNNGLPDNWEIANFGHIGVDPNADPDGDGITNLQEYQAGTDPNDYYNGHLPTLLISSGNNQTGIVNQFNAQPMVLTVKDSSGSVPLANAPITVAVEYGDGLLSVGNTDPGSATLELSLRTDANGNASVYYLQPARAGELSYVLVWVSPVSVSFQSTSVANTPPAVTLSSPSQGATFAAPASINLVANASDSDGTVAKVDFYQGTTLLGTSTTAPYTFNWTNVSAGSYALTAKATDNVGAVTTSAAVTISVNAAPQVVVSAGPAQTGLMHSSVASNIATPFFVQTITTTPVNSPIGFTYNPVLNKIILSTNYPNGTPYNFESLNPDGSHVQFSTISGLSDEVMMDAAPDDGGGLSAGGFPAGTMFCGSGIGGVIVKISPDGTQITNPWVTLPNESGLMRGALHLDRSGSWGGDLIVATTSGGIWRVNAAGVPTKIAQLSAASWEALVTLPADSGKWGPWAGKILVGDENSMTYYAIDANGATTTYNLGIASTEYFNLVPVGQNLYGVSNNGKIYCVASTAFTNMVGDLLVSAEVGGAWTQIHWNGSAFKVTTLSTAPGALESAGFAPVGVNDFSNPTAVSVQLNGSVVENGAAAPSSMVAQWSFVSGPAPVTFASGTSPQTTASFTVPGTYVLKLSAHDGTLSGSGTVPVTIDVNQIPSVYAGGSRAVSAPNVPTALNGVVVDDGLPNPPGTTTQQWSKVSGPGNVTFGNSAAAATTAAFDAPGTYVLKLSATDGLDTGVDTMEARLGVAVVEPPANIAAWWPGNDRPAEVIHGKHDVTFVNTASGASNFAGGQVSDGFIFDGVASYGTVAASSDLDVGTSTAGFTVEFWVRDDKVSAGDSTLFEWRNVASGVTGVELRADGNGQNADFFLRTTTGAAFGVSAIGAFLGQQSQWVHLAFTYDRITGEARVVRNGIIAAQSFFPPNLTAQTSSDLYFGGRPDQGAFKGMLDEVTLYRRPLTYSEIAGIFNASFSGKAPPDAHLPPTVSAGPNAFAATPSNPVTLAGSVLSDNQPFGPPSLQWSVVSSPAGATWAFSNPNAAQTTVTFSAPGDYQLRLTANDGYTAPVSSQTEVRVGTAAAQAPTGIVGWWPGNGSNLDVVRGHSVELFNDAGFAAGAVLQGFTFDGNDDYGLVHANADDDIGRSAAGFSFEFWIRNDRVGVSDNTLFEWRNVAANLTGLELRADALGQNADLHLRTSTGATYNVSATNFFASAQGVWLHIAFTYDASTGLAQLYRNGLIAASAYFPTGLIAQTSYDLYLGGRPDQGAFKGMLDEVALYTRPLSYSEIAGIYAAGADGKSPLLTHQAPVVSAGPNVFLPTTSATATLAGSAVDDHQPFGPPTVTWSMLSGPATPTFANSTSAQTTATFPVAGTYLLQLTANDGLTAPVTAVTEVRVGTSTVAAPSGVAAWWPGNGSPHELVHGNHDVQLINDATYAPGQVLDGFLFDGIDDYGQVPAHPDLNIGQSTAGFSIEFWIRNDRVGVADNTFFEWRNVAAGLTGLEWRADATGKNADMFFRTTGGSTYGVTVAGVFTGAQGQWIHLAFTYDAATGRARIYRNGILGIDTFIPAHLIAQTSYDVFLGGRPDQGAFKGMLDEVTLYNRPLSDTEVVSIFNGGANGKNPLIAHSAPTVLAGPNVFSPNATTAVPLNGSVISDNQPSGAPSLAWSQVASSGTGVVQFTNPAVAQTTATGSAPGDYLLALTASDGVTTPVTSYTELRVGTAAAQPPSGLAAWWPGNGTPHELVHGNHDVQFINDTSYAASEVLEGFHFEGVDDYGIVPAHADLDIGQSTAGFSIECWIRNDRVSAGDNTFFEWRNLNSGASGVEWRADGNGQNAHLILRATNGSTYDVSAASAFVGQQGAWIHLAFTYDRTTGRARIFRNGIIAIESYLPVGIVAQTSYDLFFGGRPDQGVFKGMLDEVSLYSRPLSAAEVAAVHSAGADGKSPLLTHTPPVVSAGPIVFLSGTDATATLAGSATDDNLPFGSPAVTWSSVSAPTGGSVTFGNLNAAATTATFTAAGSYLLELTAYDGLTAPVSAFTEVRVAAPSVTPPSGLVAWWPGNGTPHELVHGGHDVELINDATYAVGQVLDGFFFDGVDDFGDVAASPDLDLGQNTAGFTIECWVRNDKVPATDNTFFEWRNLVTGNSGVEWRADGTGQNAHLIFRTTSGAAYDISAASVFTGQQGQWIHLAFTYDRTSGNAIIYKNGAVAAQTAIPAGLIAQTTYDVLFGGQPAQGAFKGMLDEVSFYNRPLTASEVATIASAGVNGKTPAIANQAPVVSIGSASGAFVGIPVQLTGVAADDGQPSQPGTLTYAWSSISTPSGATVTFGSASSLNTTAAFSAPGTYVVQLAASDSLLTGTAKVSVNVSVSTSVPTDALTSPTANTSYALGAPIQLTATATDSGAAIAKVDFYSGSTLIGTATVPLAGQPTSYGLLSNYTPTATGAYSLTAVATDTNGVTATSPTVTVNVINDPGAPVARISTPSDTGRVSAPTSITGVISSPMLTAWTLDYRLKAPEGATPDPWISLAKGTAAIGTAGPDPSTDVPGVLGQFDPTMVINGIYELRVTATDTSGRTTAADPISIIVEGNLKLGVFSLAFEDLKVPVGGIPITATRTYDTRDLRVGDFGPGWRLAIANIRVQKNRNLGQGWFQTPQSGTGIQFYNVDPLGDRIVTVTMPDGKTDRFKIGAVVNNRVGDPDDASYAVVVTQGNLKFYPIGDTTSTLEPLDGNNQLAAHFYIDGTGDQDLMTAPFGDTSAVVYNTTRFRLTTKEGTVYLLDEVLGLLQMTDRNGNTLVVNRDASNRVISVVSTQNPQLGNAVTTSMVVHRDSTGRVDYIQDPTGKTVDYLYDAQGRLSSFTDRLLNVTAFFYENPAFPNYLTRIVDPRGVNALRSEYDSSGRMIKQIDASGKETDFAPGSNATGNFETVTDRLGNATTFYYDAQGNVVQRVDALGGVTTYTYDANNNQTSTTDPLGHTTTSTYDERGNLLTQTDPLGDATTFTYNSFGEPLTITDPRGKTITKSYDSFGDLTQTTDPKGNTTTYNYDAAGRVTLVTDALGGSTTTTYTAQGWVASSTDPLGHTSTFTYDGNGNQLTTTVTRTLSSGATETDTTSYAYDAENRVIKTTFPDGTSTQTTYNAIGKPASVLDSLGNTTAYTYDDHGNRIVTSYADGSFETTLYDAEGHLIGATDRLGHTTTQTYDALNRPVKVTYADGTVTQTGYDAANRAISTTDARGNVTRFVYDAAGRRTQVRQYLNASVAASDADLHLVAGSTGLILSINGMDAGGNRISLTDPLGHTTSYAYDDSGLRTTVTYPDSTTQVTGYDALGRRISVTDQSGKIARYRYDAASHLIEVRQYLDQSVAASDSDFSHAANDADVVSTTYGYDELGHQISQTDAQGRVTTFAYDAMGRRTSRTLPGGQVESYSYDAAGNLKAKTDFNGFTTTLRYDSLDRLIEKDADPRHPSLALGQAPAKIIYGYNAAGLRSGATSFNAAGSAIYSETLSYDTRNRLITKAASVGTVNYGYDAQSNLASLSSNNASGANVTYQYDALNRLASASSLDPSDGTRKETDYSYDSAGNLGTVALPNSVTAAYVYDPLNRLTSMTVGRLTTQLAGYNYTLDSSGHRTGITDFNGRATTYVYDPLYRLTNETVAVGTSDPAPVGSIAYILDKVGNRLGRTVTGGLSSVLSSPTSSYDSNDRLTTDAYDANGNTLSGGVVVGSVAQPPGSTTDVYDFENRLIRRTTAGGAMTIDSSYDADGIRIGETISSGGTTNTVTFLVDQLNPTGYAQVVEEKVNGLLTRIYAYGLQRISETQYGLFNGWSTSYFGYDGHGSVRELFDLDGTVTDTYTYDAFGTLINSTTNQTQPTFNRYLYVGEQYDSNLGLYYLRARYMNPDSGRFWSADSFEGFAADPASLHRYNYCAGCPTYFLDPSGNMTLYEVGLTAGVVGILAKVAVPALRNAGFNATADFADALGNLSIGISLLTAAPAVGAANPWLGTYMASRGVDYMCTGLYSMFTGQPRDGTFAAEFVHELGGNIHWAEFALDLPMLVAAVAELKTAIGPVLKVRALDVYQRLKNFVTAAAEEGGGTSVGQAAETTTTTANEGIYEFTAASGKTYVGQSGDIAARIDQHLASGKLLEEDLSTLQTTEVLGGKTAREIAEQLRINELGGVDNLENIRNPIGPARQYLLQGNGPP